MWCVLLHAQILNIIGIKYIVLYCICKQTKGTHRYCYKKMTLRARTQSNV